jgi:hypothetical protein
MALSVGDTKARQSTVYQAVYTIPALDYDAPPPPNAKLVLLASHAITKVHINHLFPCF